MNPNYLDFEQPIIEIAAKIDELHYAGENAGESFESEIKTLEGRLKSLREKTFAKLTPWQVSQMARHPLRPYALDYIHHIFTDFQELHGDRVFSDDAAIVGGLARLNGRSVMVIGQQKGRETKEKIARNFGMPRPEGYRKALRLFDMAEKFSLPIINLIDTPGAYPGIGAEERNQSEAIARNLFRLAEINVPVVCVVIGEGGSGGALAIGVGDRVMMLQYATYSVISPEGCASILWKSADRASDAAEAMGITSERLYELGLIDSVIPEPLGGAHNDVSATAASVSAHIASALKSLQSLTDEERLSMRRERFAQFGRFVD